MLYRCTAETLLMLAEKLSKPVERSRLWHRSKGGMDLAAPPEQVLSACLEDHLAR
jgi:hypothetical protein